jgi:hypothetical protein
MNNLLLCLLTSITFIHSLQAQTKHPTLEKAHLIYKVSYSNLYTGVNHRWKISIAFDKENVRINETLYNNTNRIRIIDKAAKEVLYLENKSASYSTVQQMVYWAQSGDSGVIMKQEEPEYKEILGYKCKKTVLDIGQRRTRTFWTTSRINTGLVLPGSPLQFEETALEFIMEEPGSIFRYTIDSINDVPDPATYFMNTPPDEYSIIVPGSVFSLNNIRENDTPMSSSITYPEYKGGPKSLKQYISMELSRISGEKDLSKISLSMRFTVSKNGSLMNVEINDYSGDEKNHKAIKTLISSMKGWSPAKARGKAVNSLVNLEL